MDYRDNSKVLKKRRQKILERLDNCQREMAQCREDLRRLYEEEDAILPSEAEADAPSAQRTQMRVIGLSGVSKSDRQQRSLDPNAASVDLENPNRGKGTPHPINAPSITAMVQQLLWETRGKQPEGLTGRELVKMINDKWWPGVSQNSILPKLYRRKDRGPFQRRGGRWILR